MIFCFRKDHSSNSVEDEFKKGRMSEQRKETVIERMGTDTQSVELA